MKVHPKEKTCLLLSFLNFIAFGLVTVILILSNAPLLIIVICFTFSCANIPITLAVCICTLQKRMKKDENTQFQSERNHLLEETIDLEAGYPRTAPDVDSEMTTHSIRTTSLPTPRLRAHPMPQLSYLVDNFMFRFMAWSRSKLRNSRFHTVSESAAFDLAQKPKRFHTRSESATMHHQEHSGHLIEEDGNESNNATDEEEDMFLIEMEDSKPQIQNIKKEKIK